MVSIDCVQLAPTTTHPWQQHAGEICGNHIVPPVWDEAINNLQHGPTPHLSQDLRQVVCQGALHRAQAGAARHRARSLCSCAVRQNLTVGVRPKLPRRPPYAHHSITHILIPLEQLGVAQLGVAQVDGPYAVICARLRTCGVQYIINTFSGLLPLDIPGLLGHRRPRSRCRRLDPGALGLACGHRPRV